MSSSRGIFVVAGYGSGSGVGAASATIFAKAGYKAALVARNEEHLKAGADKIKALGGEAAPFPLKAYDASNIHTVFEAIKKHWPNEPIRAALWNVSSDKFKPFLEFTDEEWVKQAQLTMVAGAAFSKECILAFKSNTSLTPEGARGTLIFTGATASIRGNKTTSLLSTGKHAIRALSQSLNKEFGKENIHVCEAIIDGYILNDFTREELGEKGKDLDAILTPEVIGENYLYLVHQHRSAWTWELDLRPAHEKW